MNAWFVIPNLNGKRWLDECLGSLRAALPERGRMCVVDNGSTDGSAEFVSQRYPDAVLLRLPKNHGFVGATNLGTDCALGAGAEAVVYLNNDTRSPQDWVRELLATADRRPEFGILGPAQRDFAGNDSPRTLAILDEHRRQRERADAGKTIRRAAACRDESLPEVVPATWVEGSAMLVRRAVFERIGMLDELYSPAYFEEVDLCRRARRAGFGVGMVPASVLEHFGAGTSTAGPAKSRQRVLLERNYLLYFAADPARRPLFAAPALAARAAKHGFKAWRSGNLSLGEWATAWRELAVRLPAAWRKMGRDRRIRPCVISPESSPSSLAQERRMAIAAAG